MSASLAVSSGLLAPSRVIDWSQAGVQGGIPNRTVVYATLNSGATSAQINSAIASCPSGQIVKLNAGTYQLSSGIIMKSNVTLRGAGANQTILKFSGFTDGLGGSGTFAIGTEGRYNAAWWDRAPGPSGADPANIKSWIGTNGQSGTYTKGATILDLGSTPTGNPNLSVGDMLVVYQNDDAGPTNGLFVSSSGGASREGSGYTRGTGERQAVRVTAINGSQVSISPGIFMDNYRTSQSPRVYWWGGDIRGVGIEDLFIEGGSGSHYTNISFFEASDSWVRRVASHETGARNHINVFLSRNITIQDSFLFQGCTGGCNGSATGYGIELFAATSTLVLNNIVANIESPFTFSTGTQGSVIAYNYETGGATGLASHEVGFLMNLYEGNITDRVRADTYHGNQNFTTVFRNRFFGKGASAIDMWAYNRYNNVIGNVLGSAGTTTQYQCLAPAKGATCYQYNTPSNAFRLGYAGGTDISPEAGVSYDPLVATTLMRWGNYDVVNRVARFNSSEVPSGLSQYGNPIPSDQTLPASLVFSAKPSWWPSAKPWPAIGPDVVGGNLDQVDGHAYSIPAQDCYSVAAGNISAFNPTQCYGSSPTPTPTPTPSPAPSPSPTPIPGPTPTPTPGANGSYSVLTNQMPANVGNSDGVSTNYELGMKFQSIQSGQITAIRFYKDSHETGTHIGRIWSSSGVQLVSVTFQNESASGWQTQALSTPLNIQSNTIYVVSVNTGNTYYVSTVNAFQISMTNGPLSGLSGNNGVFGSSGQFPAHSYQSSNYFRDIVFVAGGTQPTPTPSPAPTPTPSPAPTPALIPQTLGYTAIGSMTDTGDAHDMNAWKCTMPASQPGMATSMSVYIKGAVSGAPNNLFQLAVYSNANGAPDKLIVATPSKVIVPDSWNTVTLPANVRLNAGATYWLAYNTNGTSDLYTQVRG